MLTLQWEQLAGLITLASISGSAITLLIVTSSRRVVARPARRENYHLRADNAALKRNNRQLFRELCDTNQTLANTRLRGTNER